MREYAFMILSKYSIIFLISYVQMIDLVFDLRNCTVLIVNHVTCPPFY